MVIKINDNISANISERTYNALKRDQIYHDLYNRYLDDEFYSWFGGNDVDLSSYPDWFWNYRPIEVFHI